MIKSNSLVAQIIVMYIHCGFVAYGYGLLRSRSAFKPSALDVKSIGLDQVLQLARIHFLITQEAVESL